MNEQQLQITDSQLLSSSVNQLTDVQKQILADWGKMRSACKDREDCLFGNHPTLLEMNESCKGSGFAAISKCLDMMNVYTNKVKLDTLQIIELSQTIFDKFFYLKETEIMLFFSDYYRAGNSNEFYGALEPNTIVTMLTKWVREKRGMAITDHDLLMKEMNKENEKPFLVTWEEFCRDNGNSSSEKPLDRLISGLDHRKVAKYTKESITESAQALIDNKWEYDDETMINARRSFMYRYGYTPEDYLRKEGKYV